MGKETIIIYSPSVRTYLIELIAILYEKEYFGFEESAHEYVEQMRQNIRTDLPQENNQVFGQQTKQSRSTKCIFQFGLTNK